MTRNILSSIDLSYQSDLSFSVQMLLKTMIYLGFYNPQQKVNPVCPKGNALSYLDVFG